MKKFLGRTVLGVPVWCWVIACVVLLVYVQSLWFWLVGVLPVTAALTQASHELTEKADALIERVERSGTGNAAVDADIETEGEEARLRAILRAKESQDDTDDPFME
jgi:hypothetical protein